MDPLASALTNIYHAHVLVSFCSYVGDGLDSVANAIREDGGICLVRNDELFVFEYAEPKSIAGLTETANGQVDADDGVASVFRLALMASITDFIQLGQYLLLPENRIFTFSMDLNDGLRLIPHVQKHNLMRLSESPSPIEGLTTLILSPSGLQAKLLGPAETPYDAGDILNRLRITGQGGWIRVGFEDGRSSTWPAQLCFFYAPSAPRVDGSKWWSAADPLTEAIQATKALEKGASMQLLLKEAEIKKELYPTPPDNIIKKEEIANLDEEDEIGVTDADFDFFDDPMAGAAAAGTLKSDATKPVAPTSVLEPFAIKQSPWSPEPLASAPPNQTQMTTPPLTAPAERSPSPPNTPLRILSPRPQSFSSLRFYPEIGCVANKYTSGGRFYCPSSPASTSSSPSPPPPRGIKRKLSGSPAANSVANSVIAESVDARLFEIRDDVQLRTVQEVHSISLDDHEFSDVTTIFADQHISYSRSPPLSIEAAECTCIIQKLSRILPLKRLTLGSIATEKYQLAPSKVLLRRNGSLLSLSSPALRFWEKFGFSPLHSPKRVISFILYPDSSWLAHSSSVLMSRISETFESCRLGSHTAANISGYEGGLVPLSIFRGDEMSSLREECIKFSKRLGDFADDFKNLMIYIVDPWADIKSRLLFSKNFLGIKRTYLSMVDDQRLSIGNNVVLKILPASLVSQAMTLPQAIIVCICREIYDRCALSETAAMGFGFTHSHKRHHSPHATLADPPPTSLSFELTANPSPSLLHENTSIHLAYAVGERWVVCAWGDDYGDFQRTEQIRIARRGGQARKLEEVLTEVWEITQEVISILNVSWRLVICRAGEFPHSERERKPFLFGHPADDLVWRSFVQAYDKVQLSLCAFDATPDITLIPRLVHETSGGVLSPATTPLESTPGTPVISMEANDDPDARIVDVGDTFTAAYLSSTSALLVKPGRSPHEYRTARIDVMQGSMKDILRQYRGLAMLAQLAGFDDGRSGISPWHLYFVEHICTSLETLL